MAPGDSLFRAQYTPEHGVFTVAYRVVESTAAVDDKMVPVVPYDYYGMEGVMALEMPIASLFKSPRLAIDFLQKQSQDCVDKCKLMNAPQAPRVSSHG